MWILERKKGVDFGEKSVDLKNKSGYFERKRVNFEEEKKSKFLKNKSVNLEKMKEWFFFLKCIFFKRCKF